MMKKRYAMMMVGMVSAATALADVAVTFTNELPVATQPGNITLDFTVDGFGNVTLDASSTSADTDVINAINAWDGVVGTTLYEPAYNSTFSIGVSGSGNLRLTTQGNLGGIGVEGQNQNKLDRPGIEEVYATPTFDGYVAALDVKSMEWTGAAGGDAQGQKARIDASTGAFNYPVDMTADGSWDVSASNVHVNVGDSLTFGNDHSVTNLGSGYVLAGFTFDLKVFEGDAAVTTTFTEGPNNNGSATNIYTVYADGTETSVANGNTGLPTEGSLVYGTGSFEWTWEAVDRFDENVFTGRVGTGWAYDGNSDTLGPKTIDNSTINLVAGEAVIMAFDLSGLTNDPGKYLRLDNLNLQNSAGSGDVSFYDASEDKYTQLTGDGPGQYPVVIGNDVFQMLNVVIEEGDKVALWRPSGTGQVRLKGFQFSSVEIVSDTAVPENVTATALDTAVLLDWDDDDTGVPLDYYSVYRSLASGVTTNDFVTNVTASAYLDLAVTNGSEYFYAVTSTGTNGNESALSAEVSAIPAPASTNVLMIQHLDATVGGSVTVTNGNELVDWADQSGNGNDAVQGPLAVQGEPQLPVRWPSASLSGSGLAGMDVRTNRSNITAFDVEDTDAFLDFSGDAALNSGFSVLVAFKADSVTTNNERNIVLGTQENMGGGANGFGLRFDRGNMQAFANSSGILTTINKSSLGGLKVVDEDTVVFAFTYKAADGLMSFWDSKNGTVATDNTAPYGNFTADAFYLAGSGNGGQFMDGMIGEVQIFSSTMSEAELISKGEALALKWGATEGSGFDIWADGWGVDIGETTDDYDNDGADNLTEYALNGNPTNAADKGQLEVMADGGFFKYVYASNNADSALSYTFIDTTDLVFQTSPQTNSYASSDAGPVAGDYTTVTNNYNTTADALFIELEIEQN